MPTYWIKGSMRYNVTVEINADSVEQALAAAEDGDWESVVEEGRWKDAWDFEALAGEESVELAGDEDEEREDEEQESE